MTLGYTHKVIKDKQDKGQYLSKEEEAYLNMEAANAAEMFIAKHKSRGAQFIVAALRQATELAGQLRDEELRKSGREPQSRESQPLERAPDMSESNNDPGNVFGSIYGAGDGIPPSHAL